MSEYTEEPEPNSQGQSITVPGRIIEDADGNPIAMGRNQTMPAGEAVWSDIRQDELDMEPIEEWERRNREGYSND